MQSSVGLALGVLLLLLAAYWISNAFSGHGAQAPGSADAAYRNFLATPYFRGLDGLRGLSVLAVVWSHVGGKSQLELLNHGNKGVELFFAISGFLVTTLLLREYRRDGGISLGNFYIRRTLRIFPLYYAVLSLYCALVHLAFSGTPKAAEFWSNLPAFASYTSNWFVGLADADQQGTTFYFAWSLATEEQFYLFWPPLLIFLLKTTRRHWVAALAAFGLIALQVLATQFATGLAGTIGASLAPAILVGVGLAVLLDDSRCFRRLYPVLGHALTAPCAALLLVLALHLDAPRLPVSAVIGVFVASICIRGDTCIHPLLQLRPLQRVGTVSYGMYLMHMLAANAARRVLGQQEGWDVFVATTVVVIAMALVSYRYFELPLLNLKKRFTAARPPSQAAGLGPTTGAA